ncbi:unnamed protein product [Lota lota]
MRDRLEMLQSVREEEWDSELDLSVPDCDSDQLDLSQEAVVLQSSDDLDGLLTEVHSLREEVTLLRLEVIRLTLNNERFVTSIRRLTLLKQDSDSIARGIHRRGEALFGRLQALGERRRQLEERKGPDSALSRIARDQHCALNRAFKAILEDYNRAEEMQREKCRVRLQRQASILGKNISDEQLDLVVDQGGKGWVELSQSLQTDGGRTSRAALCEIKGRHKELVELEARIKEVHDLFLHTAMVVEQQGCLVNNIEDYVCSTREYVHETNVHIKTALRYKRRNPFKQCCPCLPCWRPVM